MYYDTNHNARTSSQGKKLKSCGMARFHETSAGGYLYDADDEAQSDVAKAAKKQRRAKRQRRRRSNNKGFTYESGASVNATIGKAVVEGPPKTKLRRKLSRAEKEDRRRSPATLKLIPGHEFLSDYTDVTSEEEVVAQTPTKKKHRRKLSRDEKEDRRRSPATLKLTPGSEDMSDHTDVHTSDDDLEPNEEKKCERAKAFREAMLRLERERAAQAEREASETVSEVEARNAQGIAWVPCADAMYIVVCNIHGSS
jgi:hypothetical protein